MKKSPTISDGMAKKILFLARHFFFERKYNITVTRNDTIGLKPPYLVLSNHVNVWDPALVNFFIEYPINFVTSDVWFNKPLFKKLLDYVGAIPKTKNVSDLYTIRRIIKSCKNNKVVGIFPEGKRSWDGVSFRPFFSTAKLIKHLKVPVITVLLKGACLANPRWSNKSRKGKIEISYRYSLSPEQIANLTTNEIYENLSNNLYHDEYEWQLKEMNTYKGSNLADNIESFLFSCPNCSSIGCNSSLGNYLKCSKCNYQVKYDEYGLLTAVNKQTYFNNPRDWNIWQHQLLSDLIINAKKNETLISDKIAYYYKGQQGIGVEKVAQGELSVTTDNLTLKNNNDTYMFNVHKISGLNIKWNDHMDFYYDNELHRFGYSDNGSAYKWVELIQMIKQSHVQSAGVR